MENLTAPKPLNLSEDSTSSERKLWLDYLKSLNDRRLQSARNSGLTDYALFALLGGVIYWATPRVPKLLSTPDIRQSTLVSIVLLGDALIYFLFAYALLVAYCKGGVEHRVIPEVRRRVANIQVWIFLFLSLIYSLFQLWVGSWLIFPSIFIRWSILGLGLWWLLNIVLGLSKRAKMIKQARKYKILLPNFTVSSIDPNIGAVVYIFTLGVIAIYSTIILVIYLHKLDWIAPLSSATIILMILAIAGILFQRGLNGATQATYDTLERDILLDHLTADAIRVRFIRDTLGSETARWLDGLLANLKSENDDLEILDAKARKLFEEINKIAPQYATERRVRAEKVIEDLKKGIEKRKSVAEGIVFQAKLFVETHKSQKEHEVLNRWIDDFKLRTEEGKKVLADCTQLLGELKIIADQRR